MKKVTVVLINNSHISSILPALDANKMMDQFYRLCFDDIDDHCFEISLKNEMDKLEHTLIPLRSILYVQCRDQI